MNPVQISLLACLQKQIKKLQSIPQKEQKEAWEIRHVVSTFGNLEAQKSRHLAKGHWVNWRLCYLREYSMEAVQAVDCWNKWKFKSIDEVGTAEINAKCPNCGDLVKQAEGAHADFERNTMGMKVGRPAQQRKLKNVKGELLCIAWSGNSKFSSYWNHSGWWTQNTASTSQSVLTTSCLSLICCS